MFLKISIVLVAADGVVSEVSHKVIGEAHYHVCKYLARKENAQ